MEDYTVVKIKKLIPSATYEGRIHTQEVVVELKEGKEITLFDGGSPIQFLETDIGKKKKLRIEIFFSELPKEKPQLIKEKEKKIIQTNNGYCIYGEITSEPQNTGKFTLDIGTGTLLFPKNNFNFKKGDYIKIFAIRLDIPKQMEFFYPILPKIKPKIVNERETKIIQTNNGYWIQGQITGEKDNILTLEAGKDKIFFPKNNQNIKKGDFVKFFAPRLDNTDEKIQ